MKAKTKRKHTNWYVEPLNAETNQSLAKLLADINGLAECADIKLADGKTCSAFQLDSYQTITKLKGSKEKFNFKYRVYSQKGPYAPIKKWIFD